MVGSSCLLLLFFLASVQPDRWIAPHLAVRALFDYGRWECLGYAACSLSPLFGLLLGLPVVDTVSCVQSLLKFRGFGRFMMNVFSSSLGVRCLFCSDQSLGSG